MSKHAENTKLKVGDHIRIKNRYGVEDFIIEEFRQCLGIFWSQHHRIAGTFTPICELWEPGPDSKPMYESNHGEYWSNEVPLWMNLPRKEVYQSTKVSA